MAGQSRSRLGRALDGKPMSTLARSARWADVPKR